MKKFLVILTVLLLAANVYSSMLEDIYFKDYGIINRIVLVFDKSVDFQINETGNDTEISILDCTQDPNIENEEFVTNKVLSSFEFIQFAEDMIVIIAAKNKVDLSHFVLPGEKYKLVIDIFGAEPVSFEDNISYAEFYQTIGKKDEAKKFYIQAENAKNNPPPKKEQKTTKPKKEKKPVTKPAKTKAKPFKLPIKPQYLFAIIFIILLLIVISVLLKRKGKSGKSKKEDFEFESTEGYGNFEFRDEMMFQLIEANWDDENIAKEMQLSVKEVEKFRKKL
jgi:hypothetical protein